METVAETAALPARVGGFMVGAWAGGGVGSGSCGSI
jgi:hypothetical protein